MMFKLDSIIPRFVEKSTAVSCGCIEEEALPLPEDGASEVEPEQSRRKPVVRNGRSWRPW